MGTTLEIQLALNGEHEQSGLVEPNQLTAAKAQFNQQFGQQLSQQCNQLISETFERAQSLARALSFFDPLSLLSQYNRGILNADSNSLPPQFSDRIDPRSIDELKSFREILGKAKILTERFPRGFILDPISRGKVDLGGIAKGAVVDDAYDWMLAELNRRLEKPLAAIGQPAALLSVNAGGDLRLSGAGAVEVRVPNSSGVEKRYNLQLLGAAVATSSHQGLHMAVGSTAATYASKFQDHSRAATVSVIAETCVWADGFAKIAFQYDLAKCVSPAEAVEFGLQAVLSFDHEGNLISTHEWILSADSSV